MAIRQALLLFGFGSTIMFSCSIATSESEKKPPAIKQKAKDTACSNIIALAGDVNIRCSSLTPEQKQLIDSIPLLLKKILARQPDPAALMDKLDQAIAASTKPSVSQSNAGGLNIQQGTTGANSPIINSPINIGNQPAAIPPDLIPQLVQFLSQAPVKATIAISADQFSSTDPLPDQVYEAFKAAGWKMKELGVSNEMAFMPPGPRYKGAEISVRGDPIPNGQMVDVKENDPLAYVGKSLAVLGIKLTLRRDQGFEEGVITIAFRGGFR